MRRDPNHHLRDEDRLHDELPRQEQWPPALHHPREVSGPMTTAFKTICARIVRWKSRLSEKHLLRSVIRFQPSKAKNGLFKGPTLTRAVDRGLA